MLIIIKTTLLNILIPLLNIVKHVLDIVTPFIQGDIFSSVLYSLSYLKRYVCFCSFALCPERQSFLDQKEKVGEYDFVMFFFNSFFLVFCFDEKFRKRFRNIDNLSL